MDCNEARALLDADVDRELSPPDALRVQQHVDECELCRRERERIVALSHAVRAADYHRAPDALRARIAALQPEAEAATAPMGGNNTLNLQLNTAAGGATNGAIAADMFATFNHLAVQGG
ncbi:anti-sigma factor family protein, partial [Burkholderia multivorans]|uniref:anti-sigma factor family protein n=1 Tax=Burkholderia multivorans TaxID=87883 RepID=UPI002011A570